jgi:hypothetical protein
MRLLALGSIALFALAIATPARGEEPLWGETASTLGAGFLNVMTDGTLYRSEPYRHHGGPVSLTIARTEFAAKVEYGIQPDLDLHLRIPYFTETIEERTAGQSAENPLSGLGEMEAGAKWRFRQSIGDRSKDELALLAELKLPTGADDLRDRHGALIAGHLQPNSGNLGARLGLAADRHTALGGYWLSGRMSAEAASSRYRRGVMLDLHASAGRRLRRLTRVDETDWMGILGLHYDWMGKDQEEGRTVRDSGGSVLSAELGLTGARRNFGARLGILLPLWIDVGKAHAPPRWEIQASIRSSY